MNILVIGNGFDLAHKLPTRYTDFLKYCADYNLEEPICDVPDLNEEFALFCKYNFWLRYFFEKIPDIEKIDNRTWIDFEKEIAEAIKLIERFAIENNPSKEVVSEREINTKEGIDILSAYNQCTCFDYDEETFDNFIYSQLKKFARAFEIYCLKINGLSVDSIISTQRSKDLEMAEIKKTTYANLAHNARGVIGNEIEVAKYELLMEEECKKYNSLYSGITPIDYLSLSKFDYVLSFNYTNTYERLYGNEKTKYCYIHGKAQADRNKTNIIFGIDDDLSAGEESKNFRWIRFKKFYQRIIFKTGSEYKDWIDSKNNQHNKNYVHIIGHSLDKTDYDVLCEIFNSQQYKIIIYYYSPEDFEDKVQNVIKLLAYKGQNGRDKLISRVHGEEWTIKFVDLYDEKEGLFIKDT